MQETILPANRDENKKFFMLYADGGNAPTMKHMTKEEMEKECERLARSTGKRIYILETIGFMEVEKPLPPPVKFMKYE